MHREDGREIKMIRLYPAAARRHGLTLGGLRTAEEGNRPGPEFQFRDLA
jgi:hypothetical protein